VRETVVALTGAFIALCTIGGFAANAVLVFGLGTALVLAGLLLKRPALGILGVFAMGVLSPFALEYSSISHELTLLAAIGLVSAAFAIMAHGALTADEKRRLDWKVDRAAAVLTVVVALAVGHSVVLIASFGTFGGFLGNADAANVQVLILACATAVVTALLLIPGGEGQGPRQA